MSSSSESDDESSSSTTSCAASFAAATVEGPGPATEVEVMALEGTVRDASSVAAVGENRRWTRRRVMAEAELDESDDPSPPKRELWDSTI
jgi:hypothetical protein